MCIYIYIYIVSADPSGWQGERAGEGLANAPGPSFRALLFCCGEEAVSELCCFGFYSAAILVRKPGRFGAVAVGESLFPCRVRKQR